jgi:hypothetical protein
MADYYISGVWKDTNGTITDYAFHLINSATKKFPTKSTKMSKAAAIKLVETVGNTVTTLTWGYLAGGWIIGQPVSVAGSGTDKYLKSAPDSKVSDNLGHLICWNCYIP